MLWNSTLQKTHWRSVGDAASTMPTPNNLTSATLLRIRPGNSFWTAGGGAQPVDAAFAVPNFIGAIILRGGVSKLQIANRVDPTSTQPSDPVKVTVFYVWTARTPAALVFPATVPLTWDPSVQSDFWRYGKVLMKREVLLKGDGEVAEFYYRHRITKIDQIVHDNGGSRLEWFILASQATNTEAVAAPENLDIVQSINYSFSADAQQLTFVS